MGIVHDGPYEAMVGDPDDHRPQTTWRLVVDPEGRARLAVLLERCAPGDAIPLHRHDVDEAIYVIDGEGEYRLGDHVEAVATGDTVFIPAGTPHGTRNTGQRPLHIHAVFPQTTVKMEMLERNPAPGTEDDLPMTSVYDFATGQFTVEGPTAG
ncbi:MAG TPA: cupin domain-containing protein [Acidimicrobiales bacterium]|nr:cupin domain-containing protein [Acidimicrobiales bacterium]